MRGASGSGDRARGDLRRRRDQSADAGDHEIRRGWLRRRPPRLELLVAREWGLGTEVEEHGGQVNSGDAVYERMVGLEHEREAPILHALHEPALPQWLAAVELLGCDPRDELEQLLLGTGRRQRRVTDVVLEVE